MFSRCVNLRTVVIPAGVASIGQGALVGCRSLETIALPQSLKDLQAFAFSGCLRLRGVTLPASIKQAGDHAFAGCLSMGTLVCAGAEPLLFGEELFSSGTGIPDLDVQVVVPQRRSRRIGQRWRGSLM